MIKLKTLLQQLLQSPRRFPVELALGVTFFIIAVLDSSVNGDILSQRLTDAGP